MQQQALPALDPLQRYSIDEAAKYLRISRAQIYKQISNGSLLTITDGSRRFVPGEVIAQRSRVPSAV